MYWWKWRKRCSYSALALLVPSIVGCGDSQPESFPAPPAKVSEEAFATDFTVSGGSVLASRELGMEVTGEGAGEPERSLVAVERRILAFLPQLQESYAQEREQDPTLLGSLQVTMTLQPDGRVSDIRFPQQRISSEKLVSAVFDRMRTWRFRPADNVVQVHYTLLFVPPEVDQASIVLWEKQLGDRAVLARYAESPPELVEPMTPAPAPRPERGLRAPVPSSRPSHGNQPRVHKEFVAGWYRVTRPSALYAAPRSTAAVVNRLRPGMLVHVVNRAANGWLEVRSVSDRPPGFLRHEDVVLESRERDRR